MTDLVDQMYCSQQILIPPTLPSILKKYAKAAIRTQPRDLLMWSLHYFKAVANDLPPPVKERIEYPPIETESGLTPGFLKVLLNQVGSVDTVSKEVIVDLWQGICLERKYAELLFRIGNFPDQVEWIKFVALAAGTIEKNLTGTMSLLCELLTEEPDGGSAMIPINTFLLLYKYLAALDCGPKEPTEYVEEERVDGVIEYSKKTKMPEILSAGDLLREVGDQKSAMTIATDDIREVDSRSGLQVWPDLVPDELKADTEVSSQPDDINSATGIPVWDDDHLKENQAEKEIIQEGEKPSKEESTSEKKKKPEESKNEAQDRPQIDEGPVRKETDVKEEHAEGDQTTPKHEAGEDENGSSSKSDEKVEEKKDVLEGGSPTEATEDKNAPIVQTLLQEDSEMNLLPTPILSQESICTDVRSIGHIQDEPDQSTENIVKVTTSIRNVNIKAERAFDELRAIDWKTEGTAHWAYIPGIGPPVPQEVVDEVEAFLRQCASKQCDMVMPRNLRHFLCPVIDGQPQENYFIPSSDSFLCREDSRGSFKKLTTCQDNHIII